MSNADIEFTDPPLQQRLGKPVADHASAADACRARPGEWARVLTDVDPSTVTGINSGRLAPYRPPGSFEAVARRSSEHKPKRADIYARFVGENGEHR